MLTGALICFVLAALGGLTLAGLHFAHRPIPLALALGHGAVAAVGLVLLILAVADPAGAGLARYALAFFVLAALGGAYLFTHQLRGRRLPTPMIFLHGLLAASGVLMLLSIYLMP